MTTNDDQLPEHERRALRAALGRPSIDNIRRTIEELERQIALEDMIVVLIESTRETVRAFFDTLVQMDGEPRRSNPASDEERERR